MRPQGVRALSSKGGLTLKEIADILGEQYDSFRQRIQRNDIKLEKGAGRRIFLTSESIKRLEETLGLDPKRVTKLKSEAL